MALFLGGDGVINAEKNYVYRIDDFQFALGIFGLCPDGPSSQRRFRPMSNAARRRKISHRGCEQLRFRVTLARVDSFFKSYGAGEPDRFPLPDLTVDRHHSFLIGTYR